ncbi:hypothetical protein ALNOE001_02900 [Candidatus Methanobinarius endosymbioticus]|uniref:Uncharacterized protein n=1 Tax=Candidatus Methanobinarius endosymbioticus TaxID=2006182 RepID=A0A366MFX6_9EURY|nr:hypothetical protein ALNOE001_02900 [Candidatus Methanobinarius endosymbioticus]
MVLLLIVKVWCHFYKETGRKYLAIVILRDDNNVLASVCRVNLFVDGKSFTYVITNEYVKPVFDLFGLAPGEHVITARNSDIGKNYLPDEKNMTVKIKGEHSTNQKYLAKNESNKGFAAMKETEMPILAIISILLTNLGIIIRKNFK